MKDGSQPGVRAGKENGVLGEPLQRGIVVEIKMLLKARQLAAAAVELARAGHGDQRVTRGVQVNGDIERIPAHDPRRGMKQVKVAGFVFRIKRALNGERTDVVSREQDGFFRGVAKPQVKGCLPAFMCVISDLSC